MDVAAIREALEQTYQANRLLIAGLADADLGRSTPNPRWTVRQLAAHIAEDDGGALYVAKLLARGKNAKAPDFVVNLANWWSLRRYRKATAADLLPVLDAKHRELLDWIASLAPDVLARGGEISGMGRLTLAEFLIRNGEHSRAHGDEIRAALGRGPEPNTTPAPVRR